MIGGVIFLTNYTIDAFSNPFISPMSTYMQQNKKFKSINLGANGFSFTNCNGSSASYVTSRVITPNHILHPNSFPFNATDINSLHGAKESLSFPMAFNKVIRAMEEILSLSYNHNPSKHIQINRLLGGDIFYSQEEILHQNYTIQIIQSVSHKVDGLCWLHANEKKIRSLSPSIVYFEKAERNFESASIGSALTIKNLDDFWGVIHNLPEGSGVYGGKRFDENGEISDEWKCFGKEIWILPSIELRTERVGDYQDANDMGHNDAMSKVSHLNKRQVTSTNLIFHLHFDSLEQLLQQVKQILTLLRKISPNVSPKVPCTDLPPIMSRSYNPAAQETFENGVNAALRLIQDSKQSVNDESSLEKVVLARRADLRFGSELNGLDVMKKLKFGGTGGHLFYLNPGYLTGHEFFGCSPEQLFQVRSSDRTVSSEALAGTRPRGSTSEADLELFKDLMISDKDRNENSITSRFIGETLNSLYEDGLLKEKIKLSNDEYEGNLYIRRLRHLQHLCKSFIINLSDEVSITEITKRILKSLNPTPAVNGYPKKYSLDFIRTYERISFDRGLYAGPFGFIGSTKSDIIVAIRSALLQNKASVSRSTEPDSILSVYAGAGIVSGSTVQSEWSETGLKLGVLSSLFSQSPLTLKSFQTPNEAWASAFVEELIRSGVTQFYVCPGSRSTPLTIALARAMRTYVGIIDCVSIHDERGAAFRALGYARATNRVAAVVTSSGTAVANLYPAVVEAGMDGIPLLLLTADRPYENRHTGANQAIDQLKIFSDTYIRWFHDISPPSDDIPITAVLSDANHAVYIAKSLHGPVHLNIQFRENLAPDTGQIRGDTRVGSIIEFSTSRFTDVPGFDRWSKSGGSWTRNYNIISQVSDDVLHDIVDLISKSKRGVIVVGNLRTDHTEGDTSNGFSLAPLICDLAEAIGMPILAGAQSAQLRFGSALVVPYAEYLLKNVDLKSALQPDLVIQIGSHLVSTEVQSLISSAMYRNSKGVHILLSVPTPSERVDALGTITHNVECNPHLFIPQLTAMAQLRGSKSNLLSLVQIGRKLAIEIPNIIHCATKTVLEEHKKVWEENKSQDKSPITTLSEPQIMLSIAEALASGQVMSVSNLFLSNSMPVRDAEFFLYPSKYDSYDTKIPFSVGVNRGASGIDGIISSAIGFTEAISQSTTLLIGDLAALHDINSFHNLCNRSKTSKTIPLSTVIVNNDGGAIFSFLPIAKHGNDVNFEEFWGTPTNSFSFKKGTEAFGLPYFCARSYAQFKEIYDNSVRDEPRVIEAQVLDRKLNVLVHSEISLQANNVIKEALSKYRSKTDGPDSKNRLSMRVYKKNERLDKGEKILLLLHGWMGDKGEWNEVAQILMNEMSDEWTVYCLDLPGHGDSPNLMSDEYTMFHPIMSSIDNTDGNEIKSDVSIDDIAATMILTLQRDYGIRYIDAIAGYSLGGRIAMAMKKVAVKNGSDLIRSDTKMILIGADPGLIKKDNPTLLVSKMNLRREQDSELAEVMLHLFTSMNLHSNSSSKGQLYWDGFLSKWYDNEKLWGRLKTRLPDTYSSLVLKRASTLSQRAPDLAFILSICSPGRSTDAYSVYMDPSNTFYISGGLDEKYTEIGKLWKDQTEGVLRTHVLEGAGHALVIERSIEVAGIIKTSLRDSQDTQESFKNTKLVQSNRQNEEIQMLRKTLASIAIMDSEEFRVEIGDGNTGKGISGVGWGEYSATTNVLNERRGLLISISSSDNSAVGLGEVSPMKGVHIETFQEARAQVKEIQRIISSPDVVLPRLTCEDVLSLDGSLGSFIDELMTVVSLQSNMPFTTFLPSVRSGIEMAILSLASHAIKTPLPLAFRNLPTPNLPMRSISSIALNGLETRKATPSMFENRSDGYDLIHYPSTKIKIGHRDVDEDIKTVMNIGSSCIRLDANRAWSFETAVIFALKLKTVLKDREVEFIEEPLAKNVSKDGAWTLEDQILCLERLYDKTGLKYALDESVADALSLVNFTTYYTEFKNLLMKTRGCAAIVLKPSLIGLERSVHLAKLAHDLGIGAVFTSTFDSGVGLSFIGFVAGLADSCHKEISELYPHGLSTFSKLKGDTLTPPFGSYVNNEGSLNLASLGRSLYGLGLDEIRDYIGNLDDIKDFSGEDFHLEDDNFQSVSSTSDTGREISLQVSLILPFSREIACTRFTDLPQQPRWSPWLNSVAYVDEEETEWTLNVRGVEFRWKAVSKMIDDPKGIMWESVSGLKNKGLVEFLKISDDSCLMRVKMTIITPRIIALVFKTTGEFVKDFVENKLLRWSLESFRDVVKADLALERGDAELGDALLCAISSRADAIEATLSYQTFDGKSST